MFLHETLTVPRVAKKTVSVYLEEDDHAQAMASRVRPVYGGVFSRYVEELVKNDLAGAPDLAAKQPILALADKFHPAVAPTLRDQFSSKPVNQGLVIARFLEALSEALVEDFDPKESFSLVDRAKAKQWEKLSEQRTLSAASELAALLNKGGMDRLAGLLNNPEHQLNEDPSPYPAAPPKQVTSPADAALAREKKRREAAAASGEAPARRPHTPKESKAE